MEKIFTAFPACLPLMAMALNTWEPPKEEPPQENPGSERDNGSGKKAKMGDPQKIPRRGRARGGRQVGVQARGRRARHDGRAMGNGTDRPLREKATSPPNARANPGARP
ncbi:hypothetical protein HMPREF1640_00180 [Prevotella sp. S7-1-8]|uniref:hypothetical protein n=1 Tax=Prevotella sp. S7-1-8 TaxID=1284775 RepID=UPI00050F1D4D|nr:hypothetical protein [Prevotella sp. S7-1-8]KGF19284.1 hypothetical protein HMPREF1640_00180 [Prevotella sp. S7-1-8]